MPTPRPDLSIHVHPDQQSDLEAVAEGLLDRIITQMAQQPGLQPADTLLSALGSSIRALGQAAQARLNGLRPDLPATNAHALASVAAYHAGEIVSDLQDRTRLAIAPSLYEQLSAGIIGASCGCAKCRAQRGTRQ
jgi:hypothetical protein